jgi:mitochondrial translocator assembly and maintenance protein 41
MLRRSIVTTTTEDDDKTATAMISSSSSSSLEGKKDAEEGQPDGDGAELLEWRRRQDDDAGQLVSHAQLRERLERALPLEHVVRVFGYGSGVFDQTLRRHSSSDVNRPKETKEVQAGRDVDDDGDAAGDDENNDDSAPLVDLIVVVNDATSFHRQNVAKNPGHYPIWRRNARVDDGVADRAAWIQRHAVPTFLQPYVTNPGAYYVIDNDTHKIKYGVVHGDDVRDDLCDWKYLYLAGRLHKPTVSVYSTPEAAAVEQAQLERNLPSALRTALLILSGTTNNIGVAHFDEHQVYETIAGLSYSGDFRMRFGAEDPHKIRNLVASAGSRARFRHLYQSAAHALELQGIVSIHPHDDSSNGTWTWDASASALRALSEPLPDRLRRAVAGSMMEGPGSSSALMSASSAPESVSLRIQDELRRIVAPAARYQSVKGLVTAGSIRTSITYALRKLRKGILKGR